MTPDSPSPIQSPPLFWRIILPLFAALLIPIFLGGACILLAAAQSAGQSHTAITDLLPVLLPPAYWILYFTCRHRPWARWLLLAIGIITVLFVIVLLYAMFLMAVYLTGGGPSH